MSDIGHAAAAGGANFSFDEIACHVWAIDGYQAGARSSAVNNAYSTAAGLITKTPKTQIDRCGALAAIVDSVREAVGTPVTAEKSRLYGGFRTGQSAPEHMWIEYNGNIYETMPGYALYAEKATDASRQKTQLENKAFGMDFIGWVDRPLTVSQKTMIDAFLKKK